MRFKGAEIAPAVDRVLGEQLVGLAKALGGALSVAGEDESGNEAAGPARPDSNLDDAMADLIRDDGATGGDAAPEPDEEPSYRGNAVRGIGNRHPALFSTSMACSLTTHCPGRENRPMTDRKSGVRGNGVR